MSEQILTTRFGSGISANTKSGLPNSARFTRNLSIYDDDDSATVNPKTIKISGSVVVDLPKWMIDTTPWSTNRYSVGDTGNIYKIDSSNTVTKDRDGSSVGHGAAGQGLEVLQDAFYYATSTTLGRNYPLSGTPTYNDDLITNGTLNLDQTQNLSSTSNTYTPPTSISETSTAVCSIVPANDPVKEIDLHVGTVGSGNWTVTMHDSLNNVLGTATVANGSMSTGYQAFAFSTPIRVMIGQTYHFHVTSTVADGTVHVLTSNDFSTANYKEFFGILIADTDYHPIIQGTNGQNGVIIIGNANYLAVYDPFAGTYNPNQITLEPGWKVRSFVRDNEFIVALCWKGTNIDSYEDGKAFWWDGIQPYYNYSKPINGGSPNAGVNFKNRIFTVLGSEGDINLGTDPFVVIQHAPNIPLTKKIEVMPGAITVWQRRVQFAYSNSDDSSIVEQGVYEFGNQSDRAISYTSVSSEVLNFGYAISTGTTKSTTLKIGMVKAYGKEMYIGWKDNTTYGIDHVARSNDPATTGSWESLINDTGAVGGQIVPAPQKQKTAKRIVVAFSTLPSGCTVTPKYKLERANSWTSGTAAVAGSTMAILDLDLAYYEIEYGFDITCTTNYPNFTGITYVFDPQENQISY